MPATQRSLFKDSDTTPASVHFAILNKEKFLEALKELYAITELALLKSKIIPLKEVIAFPNRDREGLLNIVSNGDTVSIRKDVLISELQQILETQTIASVLYCL